MSLSGKKNKDQCESAGSLPIAVPLFIHLLLFLLILAHLGQSELARFYKILAIISLTHVGPSKQTRALILVRAPGKAKIPIMSSPPLTPSHFFNNLSQLFFPYILLNIAIRDFLKISTFSYFSSYL